MYNYTIIYFYIYQIDKKFLKNQTFPNVSKMFREENLNILLVGYKLIKPPCKII